MKKQPPRARQAGFTLVELMVSMAIGLAIVLALLILLVDVNRHNSELGKSSRMVENGRYALQVLGEDIAHAGYWGGYVPRFDDLTFPGVPNDVPAALPDPCLSYTPPWTDAQKSLLVGVPVQGYEIPSPVPTPTLGVCADKIVRPKASTDVLFVRHTETCVPGVGNCPAVAANELYFQVARCGNTVIDPGYVMSADATALTAQNRDCTTTAEMRRMVSNLYYVRDHAVTVGDGIPTLMRSQFGLASGALQHKTAEPLVEGIEGFRVEYGIDNLSDTGAAVAPAAAIVWTDTKTKVSPVNRGDGIPDGNYIRCTTAAPCTAEQMMHAAAARLYVLVRSERASPGYTDNKTYTLGSTTLGPFNDGFKRQLYVQTIRLQNLSSRRETP